MRPAAGAAAGMGTATKASRAAMAVGVRRKVTSAAVRAINVHLVLNAVLTRMGMNTVLRSAFPVSFFPM